MRFLFIITYFFLTLPVCSECRRWTVADGLPTGEVQQIVQLPNGQMLLNCEGVYCISNGSSFDVVPFDRTRVHPLRSYVSTYGQLWQGDSLLWLRDFYSLYLFDARSRSFRYDISQRLDNRELQRFVKGIIERPAPSARQWHIIDSLAIDNWDVMTEDRQGGQWIGTRADGVVYLPPSRYRAVTLHGKDPLISMARSTTDRQGNIWHCRGDGLTCETPKEKVHYGRHNVTSLPHDKTTFIAQLPDSRYLLCDSLCHLGYFLPSQHLFVPLASRIPALKRYRYFVGACVINQRLTAVYTQNGIFILDILSDTMLSFPHAREIERYSNKYNCMLRDNSGTLWVGTQNGLFRLTPQSSSKEYATQYTLQRISGLANNCIRSLVADSHGDVWAGTSWGVSRITPTVINLGHEDGVPTVSMMERSACRLTDGRLVFVTNSTSAVAFHPDSLIAGTKPMPVVITSLLVNGSSVVVPSTSASLTLPSSSNYLTFSFSTLDYAHPSHTRYRCRLRGLEKEWKERATTDGHMIASYTALPPGEYVFEAQAANADGKWGATSYCPVVIEPPLWLSWWAKLLYSIAVTAIVAYLIWLYLRMKRRKMERENDERVNRLFELRDNARHHFAQSAVISPEKLGTNAEEETLVAMMLKAVQENMSVEDYGVDMLARDVNMSRANLYKKLQTMLGVTPADFIRNVRLKHAATLLAETQLSIADIATKSGFATARNFSSSFKKMFGVTPTEYRSAR